MIPQKQQRVIVTVKTVFSCPDCNHFYVKQPTKLLKLPDRRKSNSSPRPNAKRVYKACALNQSLQNRLQGKIPPETYFCITLGSQQAPPPAAVNPLHAFTEASTHIKHTVISLMCCSSEGERQAD